MKARISVLGAGNGGQALSAHLAMKGYEVKLYEHPRFKEHIAGIRKKGGIELTGAINGFGEVSVATTDIENALRDTGAVMIVVPSFAQRTMIQLASPYLVDNQAIVLIPGNFGSLEITKTLIDTGVKKKLNIAETDSLPYACRQIEAGKIDVWGIKSSLSIAALPAVDTEDVVKVLKDFFPVSLNPAKNILEIGFSNPNMILHCSTMILNAGRIESTKGDFMFYREGMTESVCRVMEKMDDERINIGKNLNLDLISSFEWLKRTYNLEGKDLHEILYTSPVYGGHGPDAPRGLSHRYITEDVPYLLVPVVSFGRLLGIQAPTIECIISLASVMNETDYFKDGRNLKVLGLSGMMLEQILKYVQEGIS